MNITKIVNLEDNFILLDKLGEGAFGIVYQAVRLDDNQTVVIKLLKFQPDLNHKTQLDIFKNEIDILRSLKYKDTCTKLMLCYTDSFVATYRGRKYYALVTAGIKGFSLATWANDYWSKNKNSPDENSILLLIFDGLLGLKYLKNKKIVHLDIKPENILVRNIDGEPELVFIDFGLSCRLDDCIQPAGGTPKYMSPERLLLEQRGERPLTPEELFKSDIFSLGLTFYEIITNRDPLVMDREDYPSILEKMPRDKSILQTNDWYSNEKIVDIISRMMINDPRYRPTIEVLIKLYLEYFPEMSEKVF